MMKEKLVQRFLRYTAVSSQSDSAQSAVPSTPGQRALAELLKEDLAALGVVDLTLSDTSVLIGRLPKRLPATMSEEAQKAVPTVGFVAHLDTVDVNLSPELHPQLVKNYDGQDVCLNREHKVFMTVAEHPELKKYVGQDILFSDGLSVLGADNKAAISNLLVALEELAQDPTKYHGELYFCFVPDEEIGLCGAKTIDFAKFPVDFAYTIDCCELGEVVYETFNAGTGKIKIQGVSAHPMSAKGVLVNPTLVAVDLINCFDRKETPENTDGRDGYIWVQAMQSNQSSAEVTLNIRDHAKVKYEARKAYIQEVVAFTQKRYPRAVINCTITDVYGNINDAITQDNRKCVDYIYQAMENLAITPKTIAMRGGTDGSFISTKGIPTPNYFTGGHNFHSNCEFLPLDSFAKSCQMTLELIRLTSGC